jgi:hypothetical protein
MDGIREQKGHYAGSDERGELRRQDWGNDEMGMVQGGDGKRLGVRQRFKGSGFSSFI